MHQKTTILHPDFSQIELLSYKEYQACHFFHKKLVKTKYSFTDTLEKIINQSIKIKLIHTYKSKNIYAFEQKFNPLSHQFYCREVGFFVAGSINVGYARSILFLPECLGDFEKKIMSLKNQSMGVFLYTLDFKRSPFIPLKLETKRDDFLGRSSLYSSKGSRLIISEIWKKNLLDL